jgi:hypothetical protein
MIELREELINYFLHLLPKNVSVTYDEKEIDKIIADHISNLVEARVMPNEVLAGGKTETEIRLDENKFWYDTLTEVFYSEGINELSQQYILKIRNGIENRMDDLRKEASQREA